jgi:Domain of unknown function (DUF4439)
MTAPGFAAWQAALAAEHAAVYGYGVVGPRVTVAEQARARTFEAQHRDLRDRLTIALARAGQSPVGAAPDYPLPFPLTAPSAARQLALRLETDAAAAWRYVIASAAADDPVRTLAQPALTGSAIRAMRWRTEITPLTPTVPFPGL